MNDRTLERLGAASGIIAALLFGVAFVIFLANDPSKVPDIAHANDATQFISSHKDAMRTELLLNSIAIIVFVWFLGNLWSRYRTAEGGPARVSAIASAGGIVGASMVLAAFVVEATAVVKPSVVNVPELYVLSSLLVGLGGAAFTVFFFASAGVILRQGALSKAVGLLAIVAGIASALGFVSIFATHGVFNSADGAFGFWVRYGAFVVWVLIASIAMMASVGATQRTPAGRSTARRSTARRSTARRSR